MLSAAAAFLSALYFAATSLNAGPTPAALMSWQPRQPLACRSSAPGCARAAPPRSMTVAARSTAAFLIDRSRLWFSSRDLHLGFRAGQASSGAAWRRAELEEIFCRGSDLDQKIAGRRAVPSVQRLPKALHEAPRVTNKSGKRSLGSECWQTQEQALPGGHPALRCSRLQRAVAINSRRLA